MLTVYLLHIAVHLIKSLASFSAAVAVIPSPSTNLLNLIALFISMHF